jgi:predicted ribosome-associated RNA-binding protein Tma20
MFKK